MKHVLGIRGVELVIHMATSHNTSLATPPTGPPLSCWYLHPRGCPAQSSFTPDVGVWVREMTLQSPTRESCSALGVDRDQWCGVHDIAVHYVDAAPPPCPPPARPAPSLPLHSCWQYFPSGCPCLGTCAASLTGDSFAADGQWKRDDWGELHGYNDTHTHCVETRVEHQNIWCGVNDVIGVWIGEPALLPPALLPPALPPPPALSSPPPSPESELSSPLPSPTLQLSSSPPSAPPAPDPMYTHMLAGALAGSFFSLLAVVVLARILCRRRRARRRYQARQPMMLRVARRRAGPRAERETAPLNKAISSTEEPPGVNMNVRRGRIFGESATVELGGAGGEDGRHTVPEADQGAQTLAHAAGLVLLEPLSELGSTGIGDQAREPSARE